MELLRIRRDSEERNYSCGGNACGRLKLRTHKSPQLMQMGGCANWVKRKMEKSICWLCVTLAIDRTCLHLADLAISTARFGRLYGYWIWHDAIVLSLLHLIIWPPCTHEGIHYLSACMLQSHSNI